MSGGLSSPIHTSSMRIENVIVTPELRFHIIPKVASFSLTQAVKDLKPQRKAYPDEVGPEYRFMVVRHPLERMVSMWVFFCYQTNRLEHDELLNYGYYRHMPFDEFLEVLFKNYYKNPHSQMQIRFRGPYHIHRLVKLENLQTEWKKMRNEFQGLRELSWAHKTEYDHWSIYFSPGLLAQAEKLFQEDLALYEKAI